MKAKFRIKKSFENYLKLRKWTINDLADHLRMTKQQVSQTLSGSMEPTMNFLHRLCALTNLKAEEVIETVFEK